MNATRTPAGPRNGQSVVELAIAMPLLLLLLLGTIDIGRVFFDYIQMRNAVVEGATYGARHPFDASGISTAVTDRGLPGDASISSATTGDCGTPRGEGTINVSAQKTFTPIYIGALDSVAGSISWSFTISATSAMRCTT